MIAEPPAPPPSFPNPMSSSPSAEALDAEKVLLWAREEAARNARRHEAAAAKPLRVTLPAAPIARAAAAPVMVEDRDLARKMEQLKSRCNVPPRYQHASRRCVDRVPVIMRGNYADRLDALWSLKDAPGIVALLGKRGAGKTYMACALVNQFVSEGRYAVYAEAMDYFIAIQETYDDGAKVTASKVETQFIRPELLVLDAMEERADTPWNDRMLVRLINKRYAANLSTVLISNQTEAEFKARVGPSITDRIRDDGAKIVCDWDSLRGRIGAAA